MALTSLSKYTRKDFQIINAFGHSIFIASQSIFILRNMVLKRHLACQTFSKCQPYSNESCLSICTYTCKIEADNQLRLWSAVYQRWWCFKYLAKSLRRRTIELQLLWWFYIVMQKWLTWNQYRTFWAENNIVNCSILKKLFSKYNTWLIFFSDNATTISEDSCYAFHYEKFLAKI